MYTYIHVNKHAAIHVHTYRQTDSVPNGFRECYRAAVSRLSIDDCTKYVYHYGLFSINVHVYLCL